jgi:hypothetical protein
MSSYSRYGVDIPERNKPEMKEVSRKIGGGWVGEVGHGLMC